MQTDRERVVSTILAKREPFTYAEVRATLQPIAPGTVSSLLSLMKSSGVVRVEDRQTTNPMTKYLLYSVVQPPLSLETAIRRMQDYARKMYLASNRHRQAMFPRRRPHFRRPVQPAAQSNPPTPTSGNSLIALRTALDKAVLYDRLLQYLGLTNEEVIAALKVEGLLD